MQYLFIKCAYVAANETEMPEYDAWLSRDTESIAANIFFFFKKNNHIWTNEIFTNEFFSTNEITTTYKQDTFS